MNTQDEPLFNHTRVSRYEHEDAQPLITLAVPLVGYTLATLLCAPFAVLVPATMSAQGPVWGMAIFAFVVLAFLARGLIRASRAFIARRSAIRSSLRALDAIYEGDDDERFAHHAMIAYGAQLGPNILTDMRTRLGRPLPGLWLNIDAESATSTHNAWPERASQMVHMEDVPKDRLVFTPPAANLWHQAARLTLPSRAVLVLSALQTRLGCMLLLWSLEITILACMMVLMIAPLWTPVPMALVGLIVFLRRMLDEKIAPRLALVTPLGVHIGADYHDPPTRTLPLESTLCIACLEPVSSLCTLVLMPGRGVMSELGEREGTASTIAPTLEALATLWGEVLASELTAAA